MDNVKVETRFANRLTFGLGTIGALALLYFFAPDKHAFYPRCLLHSLSGWDCPFCGSLRATHQLLHGNLHTAVALNPLFVLVIAPFIVFVSISKVFSAVTGRKVFNFVPSKAFIWSTIGIIAIFGIVRNIPAFR